MGELGYEAGKKTKGNAISTILLSVIIASN
jgi:hypothetical protein